MLIRLENRALIKVEGEGVLAFLQGLVTQDVMHLPVFTALLTPQGKIIADFFVVAVDDYFIIDVALAQQSVLLQRLNMYKLRAKITFTPLGDEFIVLAGSGLEGEFSYQDPRCAALGNRIICHISQMPQLQGTIDDYTEIRIENAVPQGGIDFVYGDVFPHEANMDRLNGVSFTKGCYVGQEIVSRMQHKAQIRKRIIRYISEGATPDAGLEVMAQDRVIGMTGSGIDQQGLMLVRLDLLEGEITAGGVLIKGEINAYNRP